MKQLFKKCISMVIALGIMSSVIPAYATNSDVCVDGKAHRIQYDGGKKPTWTEPGWHPYEFCSIEDCPYSTFEAIPALGEPEIESFDDFVYNLLLLETLANEYVMAYPGNDPLELIIKYIRTGVDRYNSGSWGIMAGYENKEFSDFVRRTENMFNLGDGSEDYPGIEDVADYYRFTALKNINNFELPNGDVVDFGHMFGTMDITYTNKNSVNHADVGGWAGDLVDLMSCSDSHTVTGTVEEMTEVVSQNYLMGNCTHSDTFSRTDMYGDLDAYYIMNEIDKNGYGEFIENEDLGMPIGPLTALIMEYFTPELSEKDRAEYLLKNRFGNVGTREQVRRAVYNEYTSNKVVTTLEGTREFTTGQENINNLRRAVCDAFADYICKLAGDYIEIESNPYYEDFDYETSSLAPGVTYEKHYATSADEKQMVYYLATADLSNPNVTVYANYNNNDPTQGWAMQRVLDQANAAQNKYGNPESAQYIENYQVVASINSDGYDMKTGEPGGLLVMNGVEHHPINASGFFGITKDGKPVIGTTEEYNTIYKDQIRDAVGGFGVTLVRNGEIAVSHTENYYNDRASRTAVGITKTGKVVFMVLDGRQEPVSCGGSMQEIAQIMLEAGCYNAVNLDGGGSTTFVAKPEGKTDLEVVSSPSDGYARSVSSTLMIVSTAPSSTKFDHARLDSDYSYATVNTPVKFTPVGLSATGNVVELPEDCTWKVATNENYASITEDGVFTGTRNRTYIIQLLNGDDVIGQTDIQIVSPDNLYFKKKSLGVVYGSSVDIPVAATYGGKEVAVKNEDIILSSIPENAGTFDGLRFTAAETNLKSAQIVAALADDTDIANSMSVNLYNQGDNTFDFDKAIGGDRQFAWDRKVSNATTDDAISYTAINSDEDMVTSYIFAIDMREIPIPTRLADLTYMLPGADAVDASAWNFLLQLAERVSVLTEVKPVLKFDERFTVDYEDVEIVNDYFYLDKTELNEETNELTLTLKWYDQTAAIKPEDANPLCMLKGIKLTPKRDVWEGGDKINAVQKGSVGYTIYLRANALYTFSSKVENQEIYGLKPFDNQAVIVGGTSEKGGYFADIYKTFEDHYTLSNALKNGWVNEEGGFAYYVDGVRLTGVKEADGYYYDFGDDGINVGQQKYTGLFEDNGKTYYAKVGVLIKSAWQLVGGDMYHCHTDGTAHTTFIQDKNFTCVRGGYIRYECDDCGTRELSGYIYPSGHEWDETYHECRVCGTVGKDIRNITINFGTLQNPWQGGLAHVAYKVGGNYPVFYATEDGINTLTWGRGARPNDDGTMKDLDITLSNAEGLGNATVNFRGMGNYYGERTLGYYIDAPSVTDVKADVTTDSITLSWKYPYGKPEKFVVYDSAGEKLGETTEKTFRIENLSPDRAYTFSIKAAARTTDGENRLLESAPVNFTASTAAMPEVIHCLSDIKAYGTDYEVKLIKQDEEYYIMLPSHADLNPLNLSFNAEEEMNGLAGVISGNNGNHNFNVTNGENICNISLNDLTTLDDKCYNISIKIGNYKQNQIKIMQGANISSMFITCDDVTKDRDFVDSVKGNEATGNMTLVNASGNKIYDGGLAQIKARGNSTFTYYDKKAYQIKLSNKSDLLGNGEEVKTWVLLANYADATLMHDKLIKDMAKQMGMNYVASSDWVNLWYDGEYRGVYLISEKNSVGSTSVDITDLEKAYENANSDYGENVVTENGENDYGCEYTYTTGLTNPDDITGGYLIELNKEDYDEANGFKTKMGKGFNIKSPEWSSEAAVKYISEYYQEFEDAVYAIDASGKYTGYNQATGKYFYQYVDIDSLVKMVVMHGISANPDGFISSVYFYKDADDVDEKMYIGPVWDQDLTMGTGWNEANLYNTNVYNRYLVEALIQIPIFKNKLAEFFEETAEDIIENAYKDGGVIDNHYETLYKNAEMNYKLWPYVKVGYPEANGHIWSGADYNTVVEDMKTWLTNRLGYLEQKIVPEFKPGDANCDGYINNRDAYLVLRYSVGYRDDNFHVEYADINNDGYINNRDAYKILRRSVGYDD